MYAYKYTYTSAHTYPYTYTYMHTYIQACIHTYIHKLYRNKQCLLCPRLQAIAPSMHSPCSVRELSEQNNPTETG